MKPKLEADKNNRPTGVAVQRLVRHPDSTMLDWAAEFLCEINTVTTGNPTAKDWQPKKDKLEINCKSETEDILVIRGGKTYGTALRECLKAAMRRMPNVES
jgi:hypothetical protein